MIKEAGLEDIVPILARAKINVLKRVLRHGGEAMRAVINQGPWIAEALELIEKAREDPRWATTPSFDEDPGFWVHLFTEENMTATAKQLEQHLGETDRREDEKRAEEEKEEDEESKEDSEVWCPTCFAVFRTTQAAASHRMRAHGYSYPGWAYAHNGQCTVCQAEFWTRRRLVLHWRTPRGAVCLERVVATVPPQDPEAVRCAAREEERMQPT